MFYFTQGMSKLGHKQLWTQWLRDIVHQDSEPICADMKNVCQRKTRQETQENKSNFLKET